MSQRCQERKSTVSFDYLVGEREHPRRNCEAKRLGGLEIDHELKLGRLYDWQVGRLGAFENPASIDANLAHTSEISIP